MKHIHVYIHVYKINFLKDVFMTYQNLENLRYKWRDFIFLLLRLPQFSNVLCTQFV